ncbi:MAG: Rid family hydrolase [Terrimicrobiaceae bacterium]|nr:Rid family hydrolase [Terrimicrobiaceae bacterium]
MPIELLSEIPGGPPAIGPYSPAIVAQGRMLFVSGQIPLDPAIGGIVRGTVAEQTEIVLTNLERVVRTAGTTLAQVVQCRVYLAELTKENFAEMNGVYARFFGGHKPVRTTLGAQLLGFDVEIEAVVALD